MNKQTFEDYLMDIHAKQYQGLDDEMPEDFNNWLLEEIGPEEIIDYAEEWHRKSLWSRFTSNAIKAWNTRTRGE